MAFHPALLTPNEIMRVHSMEHLIRENCKLCGKKMTRRMGKNGDAVEVWSFCPGKCEYGFILSMDPEDGAEPAG